MNNDNVKNLYAIYSAKWYNPFMRVYNKLFLSGAENEMVAFLKNNLNETKTILELGCGTGRNLKKIYSLNLEFKKYIGLDFSPDMLDIAKNKFKKNSNVEFREKDITKLDDIKENFDIILCVVVLSHLKDRPGFVNKSQELLSNGGSYFLMMHTKPKWYIIWMDLFSKLFKTNLIPGNETQKFKNTIRLNKYSGDLITTVVIQK